MIDTTKLRELAQKATPQNFETAQIKTGNDASIECPFCGGEGLIASEGGYCNYDGVAIGVEFYGVGTEFGQQRRITVPPPQPPCWRYWMS